MERSLIKLFILILLGVTFVGCRDAGAFIDVSYYGSVGGDLNLIIDTEGTGLLSSGSERKVSLSEPSKEMNPWTARNGGDFYVTTDSEDNMATYGKIAYIDAKLSDGEVTLQTFSHLGEEKVHIGADFDGRVWCIRGENPPVFAVEAMYRTLALPDGEERTLLMCNGDMTGGKWIGNLGGKILRDSGNGRLEEIGLVGWRLIKLESGSYMTIMMTKTLHKGAKWKGRFNGTLYVDK
jgi:hypothetical protein